MTAYSHSTGHLLKNKNEKWVYVDTGDEVDDFRPCKKCKRRPLPGGYDACLGKIAGVENACCGHGVRKGFSN